MKTYKVTVTRTVYFNDKCDDVNSEDEAYDLVVDNFDLEEDLFLDNVQITVKTLS